jgi:hypothetical protein
MEEWMFKNGVMECWSDVDQCSNSPILQFVTIFKLLKGGYHERE